MMTISIEWLSILFFMMAMLYSSVGFAGGSSYISLLLFFGLDYQVTPIVALCCNLIVSGNSGVKIILYDNFHLKQIFPFLILSIPLSYVGARVPLDSSSYKIVAGAVLLMSSLLLMFNIEIFRGRFKQQVSLRFVMSSLIGGGIGFLSGIIGIGGGIILAPILYITTSIPALIIAKMATIFIFINSIFALFGHVIKQQLNLAILNYFWPLLLAVALGGIIGNIFVLNRLKKTLLKRLTGILILIVSIRLLLNNSF